MKDSIVFPGFESFDETTYIDNSHNVLDPEINFPKFLEEARRYAKEKKQRQKEEEEAAAKSGSKKQVTNDEKKSRKKSWKNAFFSFWKSSSSHNKDNTKQHSKEMSRASLNPKPSGHFSGPVEGAVAGAGPRHQHRFSSSGPLTGLLQHKKLNEKKKKMMKKKGGDYEIPYVSLEKLNEPLYDAKNYGPVYLVS